MHKLLNTYRRRHDDLFTGVSSVAAVTVEGLRVECSTITRQAQGAT
jgi:hypothetical protein